MQLFCAVLSVCVTELCGGQMQEVARLLLWLQNCRTEDHIKHHICQVIISHQHCMYLQMKIILKTQITQITKYSILFCKTL